MSDDVVKNETGPRLHPNDRVTFLDSHRPRLADGDYTLSFTQTVPSLELSAERSITFSVAGPRFQLSPSEIGSTFPPQGANGDFGNVLPHVIFKRGTLPWERLATVERPASGAQNTRPHTQPDDAPGWLALLLFSEDEALPPVSIVKAESLLATAGEPSPAVQDGASFAPLRVMSGDDPAQAVQVIDLPFSLAETVLPTVTDLAFLSTARQINNDLPSSIVVSHRLPKPGARNFVHLVSLEHQYRLKKDDDSSKHWRENHEHWTRTITPGSSIRLVSLASWDFFCTESPGNLKDILGHLDKSNLVHSATGLTRAQDAVARGFTPVEYRLQDSTRTAAWYRGPLQVTPRGGSVELPTRRADTLIHNDPDTGMRDISLAAAWELGRLLAIKNVTVTMHLAQWKRQIAHATAETEHTVAAELLGHSLPVSPLLPLDVHNWFARALGRLESVPFDYLVPDPMLLAQESLCWFALDPQWMAALYDGGFSVGRSSKRQHEADKKLLQTLPAPARSGMILRSKAVTGWPDLIVDGFEEDTKRKVAPVRYERIGTDTLLVLFDVRVSGISIHLHAQAMHFGFDVDSAQQAGLSKNAQPLQFRNAGLRILDMDGLAIALDVTAGHRFTDAMIERLPKFTYSFGLPHA